MVYSDILPKHLVEVIENDAIYFDENKMLAIDYFSNKVNFIKMIN